MKSDNLLSSFKYAFAGILRAFKTERNLKVHILATIMVVILGFILNISAFEWVSLVLTITLVIGCELINTSIEEVVNLLSPEIKVHAKYAKDIAAGAVLIFAIGSVVNALIIFLPKILNI